MIHLRYILLLSNIILFLVGNSQPKRVENLPNFDQKLYHFGFSLGANSADYSIRHNNLLSPDTLLTLNVERQGGFNLNIVSAFHFTELWSIRFIPGLSFAQRNVVYRRIKNGITLPDKPVPIESTYLDFPLLFKYRSLRNNNFAAYVIGGGKYSLDLASQAHVDNNINDPEDIVLKTKRHIYLAEIGAGGDFFLTYFKFAIQLKYSFGLHNVFINDGTQFAAPIEFVRPKMLTFSLTFEG
ncbi:MAG: PorT family protein [Flavobacteriales bacterium]|nr:PorT family protein [Flavobacteriales bacterium]